MFSKAKLLYYDIAHHFQINSVDIYSKVWNFHETNNIASYRLNDICMTYCCDNNRNNY